MWQEELVLAHTMSDRELSKIVGHGVQAIQIKRCRLKKELRKNGRDAEENQQVQNEP